MLHSEFLQELLGRRMASRTYIFESALDARDGFLKVPLFAVEVVGQGLVERFGRVLAVLTREPF